MTLEDLSLFLEGGCCLGFKELIMAEDKSPHNYAVCKNHTHKFFKRMLIYHDTDNTMQISREISFRPWFGQFDELYFILNWLVMRCKLWPELAADTQQTA